MFVLTFSPLGEKVNTNMALIHRQVKKSTLGKIVNNHPMFWNLEFVSQQFAYIVCEIYYLLEMHSIA